MMTDPSKLKGVLLRRTKLGIKHQYGEALPRCFVWVDPSGNPSALQFELPDDEKARLDEVLGDYNPLVWQVKTGVKTGDKKAYEPEGPSRMTKKEKNEFALDVLDGLAPQLPPMLAQGGKEYKDPLRECRRHAWLVEPMTCRWCNTVWPAKSITKSRFESIQSQCGKTDVKCMSVIECGPMLKGDLWLGPRHPKLTASPEMVLDAEARGMSVSIHPNDGVCYEPL